MKIITRITLLALLALLIGAAGCGAKDDDSDSAPDSKTTAGTMKNEGATGKESGKSAVGGFGK